MKKYSALILSAIIAGSAVLGGCGGSEEGGLFGSAVSSDKQSSQTVSVVSADESSEEESSKEENSEEESSKEESSKEESSKEESSKEESSKEESSKEESSKEESSKEESSKEESSKEESSDDESSVQESVLGQYEYEYLMLKHYLDSELEKSGSREYSTEYNGEVHTMPGYELSWEMLTSVISDFNKDGSPELIVQYGVSPKDGWDKQGIALEIIKYTNGKIRRFRARELIEYTRIAGAGYAPKEIVDELYVDPNGDLSILHTRTSGTSPVSAVYYTYTLHDGSLTETNNLYVSKEGFYGQPESEIYNNDKAGYVVSDDKCSVFVFSRMTAPPPEPHVYFSAEEGAALQKKYTSLELIEYFAVEDSIVHEMERNYGYDASGAVFVSYDEMLKAYNASH